MLRRSVLLLAMVSVLSGCSIRPLPEDISGVDTYHIVRRIRCEARDYLRHAIIVWLDDMADRTGDPLPRGLALQYRNDPDAFVRFHSRLFPGPRYAQVRRLIDLFYDAGIAYNFDLTMSEDNDLAGDVNFLKPLTRPKFTLGISAGAKRKRTNNRLFTVTDTFSFLVTKLDVPGSSPRYCDDQIVQENYIYPITGRIGIGKLIRSFIELTAFANLAGKDARPGGGGAPTMADKLTFVTTINASATPRVEFAPLGEAFQLANASLTGSAVRTDMHQVTIGLAIDPGALVHLDPLRSFLFSGARGGTPVAGSRTGRGLIGNVYIGQRVTGGGTRSEALAVLAIDQLKSRELEIVTTP
jgi:hypothetical protein